MENKFITCAFMRLLLSTEDLLYIEQNVSKNIKKFNYKVLGDRFLLSTDDEKIVNYFKCYYIGLSDRGHKTYHGLIQNEQLFASYLNEINYLKYNDKIYILGSISDESLIKNSYGLYDIIFDCKEINENCIESHSKYLLQII